jgi:signal transduction histidine kinase/CheY-like chemotaxis protein
MSSARPRLKYHAIAVLAIVTVTVLTLGWVVATDLRRSADDTHQLYDRFAKGNALIDSVLIETEEVRRILLYALHTLDANHQLQYAEQSRAAEAKVNRLLESQSALLGNPQTRSGLQRVIAAWNQYVVVRDEVIGLILEGSLKEGVALDQQEGEQRFVAVRRAIGELKASFEADAAKQVAEQRERADGDMMRLSLMVVGTLLATAIGTYLFNRRAALEGVLTDRRQAEEHLRQAKEAAEAATRVKGDFLATMSHELRTPLTSVVGIADLLDARVLAAPERELVRRLRSSATTLLSLVNDVLDYSRIEAGLMALNPVPFSLRNVIEQALDPVTELAARKGIDLGYAIDPDVPRVVADQDRIRQVLINLLSNAVKFTDTGGVAVRVSARTDDQRVAVSIGVHDTGVGIPAHLQHKLFQRFSQIDANSQPGGAGLGLAISERLSRLLGGSITVESRDGRGSTFTFTFTAPIAPPSPSDSPAGALRGIENSAPEQPPLAPQPLTILLVEDNEANRRVVLLMLAELGLTADEAASGLEAVERARQRRYDVILMDVQMPDIDGLEATRRIRAGEGDLKAIILALTANVMESDEARCREAGMNGYLSKPIRLNTLEAALTSLASPRS